MIILVAIVIDSMSETHSGTSENPVLVESQTTESQIAPTNIAPVDPLPPPPISPPPIKNVKRRRGVTDADRKDIRDYYYLDQKRACTHQAVRDWFLDTHYHQISQSTVSDTLSDQYKRLDNVKKASTEAYRSTKGDWPVLEEALFEWQSRINATGATVTGDLLKAKAAVLFELLPQHRGDDPPRFSTGWLDGFKARYRIKRYRRYGESAVVDKVTVEVELEGIRGAIKEYELDDMYNMDESALFWKMLPDATLTDRQLSGGKLEKQRITVNFCCNATGTHKLPPWFIGKAEKPRCFGRAGIHIDKLNLQWRNNQKAWMTGRLFREYLRWMDRQVAPRKVVLLIDGFSAHKAGIDLLYATHPQGLEHITILFLPANATSICQPLDQGIIKAWKAQYRKKWLSYVIRQYEEDKNPFKTMNVLQALRWGIDAWEYDVTATTIFNCWKKSRVLVGRYHTADPRRDEHSGWANHVAEDDESRQEDQLRLISRSSNLRIGSRRPWISTPS